MRRFALNRRLTAVAAAIALAIGSTIQATAYPGAPPEVAGMSSWDQQLVNDIIQAPTDNSQAFAILAHVPDIVVTLDTDAITDSGFGKSAMMIGGATSAIGSITGRTATVPQLAVAFAAVDANVEPARSDPLIC